MHMRRKILSKSTGNYRNGGSWFELFRGGMEPMETMFFALRSHFHLRCPDSCVWEVYANVNASSMKLKIFHSLR